MRTYQQLTSQQRYQISALKRIGHSQTEIAQELEVHKSTISREVYRNTGERGYRPKQASEKACERRTKAAHNKRISAETWKVVEEKLCQDWSPEQVSGGWKNIRKYELVMSGFINTYWLINKQEATCIPICRNTQSAANAMAGTIDVENCPIASVLKNDPRSQRSANV